MQILNTETLLSKPPNGIDICFQNINYGVEVQQRVSGLNLPFTKKYKRKTILDNVSGICKSGRVTAIMGSSGAGKTSLLNVIACRIGLGQGRGQLWANNKTYNYEDFGNFANYVMQTDVLMSTLTVRQTLTFAANLKLDCSRGEKDQKILKLSKQLKLQSCLDVMVGGQFIKGISGGQRKRTSIGFELISDPQVIILDQPTSGLDSLTSFIIIQYLALLAKQNSKTVIMTIHQPNSDIFALFNDIFLMVEGRLIYHGTAKQSTKYFYENFGLGCPEFYNPADYFMSIMHQENVKNRARFPSYFDTFDKSISPVIAKEIQNRNKSEIVNRKVQLSLSTTYSQLVARDFKNVLRNPLMIKSRFLQTTALYIYVGGLYYNLTQNGNYTDFKTFLAMAGFFFFLSLNSFMIALVPVTLIFPTQRQIFLKEQGSKLYSTTAYFISRNIIQIPYGFIFPLLQALIIYWFIGLSNTASQFFIFYLILYLVGFNGMSLGLFLGSLSKDARSVTTLAPALAQIVAVLSGYFKNLSNIPMWIGWIQYLSPMRYSYQAFVENQVQFAPASSIDKLNLNLSIWGCVGLLIALGVGFRLLSLFFLWILRSRLQ